MPPSQLSLEQRLAELERSHDRLRRLAFAGIVLLVAFASLGTASESPQPPNLVARSIQLLDDDGKLRILINHRAGISLLDQEGRPRAVLSLDATGPGLALYGSTSRVGAILSVNDAGPALAMRDNGGKTRAVLTAIDQGPALILSDEHERERIALLQRADEASIGVLNGRGAYTWHTP